MTRPKQVPCSRSCCAAGAPPCRRHRGVGPRSPASRILRPSLAAAGGCGSRLRDAFNSHDPQPPVRWSAAVDDRDGVMHGTRIVWAIDGPLPGSSTSWSGGRAGGQSTLLWPSNAASACAHWSIDAGMNTAGGYGAAARLRPTLGQQGTAVHACFARGRLVATLPTFRPSLR